MTRNPRNGRPAQLAGSIHKHAESSPGFLFWKTYNAWCRRIRAELEALDLTQVQYAIMAAASYLASTGNPVSQQDVADQLAMDKMMVSDVMKTLERKKWIFRTPHPYDGRSIALGLTPLGKSYLKKAVPVVEGADARFFGRLSKNQQKELLAALVCLAGESAE